MIDWTAFIRTAAVTFWWKTGLSRSAFNHQRQRTSLRSRASPGWNWNASGNTADGRACYDYDDCLCAIQLFIEQTRRLDKLP